MSDQEATWFREQLRGLDAPAKGFSGDHAEEVRLENARAIAHRCRQRVEEHDPYTKEHSVRVATWSKVIARRLPTFSNERLTRLEITALVHDYGKIDVPSKILNKQERLTPDEFAEVMKHPVVGAQRLEPFRDYIEMDGVMYHHLRFDGGGYPGDRRRTGNDIPIEARIIAVGDTFDALTSDRAYRRGLTPAQALEIMRKVAGKQLDPTLLRIFEGYHALESATKGYEVGAQTMAIAATVDDEVRRARAFLRREVGDFDTLAPLAKVADKDGFVRRASDALVSLTVSRDAAEKFARYAYHLPLRETFERTDLALSDGEWDDLRARAGGSRKGHTEIVLPLRELRSEFRTIDIAVFQQKLWKCTGDGMKMLLLR